jgi:hypothetical protein
MPLHCLNVSIDVTVYYAVPPVGHKIETAWGRGYMKEGTVADRFSIVVC